MCSRTPHSAELTTYYIVTGSNCNFPFLPRYSILTAFLFFIPRFCVQFETMCMNSFGMLQKTLLIAVFLIYGKYTWLKSTRKGFCCAQNFLQFQPLSFVFHMRSSLIVLLLLCTTTHYGLFHSFRHLYPGKGYFAFTFRDVINSYNWWLFFILHTALVLEYLAQAL